MATSLPTYLLSAHNCFSRPSHQPASLCFSSTPSLFSSFRALPFDPFLKRSSRGGLGGALLVRSSLEQFEPIDAASDLLSRAAPEFFARAEGVLYTLADAAASSDAAVVDTAQRQSRDWLSGLTDGLEFVLKFLKDGLQAVHVPYAYGFAIILLTVLVKAATFPLTKKQVESTLAMQSLSPKIKAVQQRYTGDQERIQLETARLYKQAGVNPLAGCLPTLATIPVWIGLYRALSNVANEGLLTEGFFWIPSLAGPTTIAARQNGSGISWIFPFVDGHPPLGWGDTVAYLVLPVLLIVSQYVSMQMLQTPQSDDPSQKNTQAIFKFLPLMIGYFSLSVPSGLSLYWLTNNVLSMGQQVWLRKLGGAKRPVGKDGGDIISAGQALRSISSPVIDATVIDDKERRRGERFRQLKMEEAQKKAERAEAVKKAAEEAQKKAEQAEAAKKAAEDTHNTAAISFSNNDGAEVVKNAAKEADNPAAVSFSDNDGDDFIDDNDEPGDEIVDLNPAEEKYSGNGAAGPDPSGTKRRQRSKRKRAA